MPLTQWPFHDPGTRAHTQMLLVIDVQKGIQTQTAEVGRRPGRVVAPSAAHVWSLTYACCCVLVLVLGVSAW